MTPAALQRNRSVTRAGFQFLLSDTYRQVWMLLREYINSAETASGEERLPQLRCQEKGGEEGGEGIRGSGRDRQIEKGRQASRQTDKQTDIHRQTEKGRQTNRQTDRQTRRERQTGRERQTHRHTDRERQTDRQTDRQIDRQAWR